MANHELIASGFLDACFFVDNYDLGGKSLGDGRSTSATHLQQDPFAPMLVPGHVLDQLIRYRAKVPPGPCCITGDLRRSFLYQVPVPRLASLLSVWAGKDRPAVGLGETGEPAELLGEPVGYTSVMLREAPEVPHISRAPELVDSQVEYSPCIDAKDTAVTFRVKGLELRHALQPPALGPLISQTEPFIELVLSDDLPVKVLYFFGAERIELALPLELHPRLAKENEPSQTTTTGQDSQTDTAELELRQPGRSSRQGGGGHLSRSTSGWGSDPRRCG